MLNPAPGADPAGRTPHPPRLLDQLRQAALAHFGRPEPGQRFADWTRRFLDFLYREVLHVDLGELPLPGPPRLLDRLRRAGRVRQG
jgi:hypothetical protein